VDGAVVAGAVLNVATGELFTATAGGGADVSSPSRSGARRLTGSRPASLSQTLVATGFGYQVEQRRAQGAVVAQLLPRVRDIRRFGSAALDLCAVAAGRIDAYYELHLNPWDHAAGALVAAEAGIVVTGLPGRPFAEPMAIAVAPSIAGPFVELLAELHA
jgi:myo-inositol-1(or 4)-monophosphatase